MFIKHVNNSLLILFIYLLKQGIFFLHPNIPINYVTTTYFNFTSYTKTLRKQLIAPASLHSRKVNVNQKVGTDYFSLGTWNRNKSVEKSTHSTNNRINNNFGLYRERESNCLRSSTESRQFSNYFSFCFA